MKNLILVGALLFLLSLVSTQTNSLAASPELDKNNVQVISQDPVENTLVAKLVVEGPTDGVKIGDLVVISVEASQATSFKWIVLPSTDNYLVIEEGKRVVFSSGVGGEFKFIVACGLGGSCDVAVHTVTVLGEAPTPTDNLSSRITFYCDAVESETKRDDCIKLAQSFASIAMIMEGGTLVTPTDIVKATMKSNKELLGENGLKNWKPFRDGLKKELKELDAKGELSDTEAHIKVWKLIARALREYSETL